MKKIRIEYITTGDDRIILAMIHHHAVTRYPYEELNDFKMRCEQYLKALIEGELTNPVEINGL